MKACPNGPEISAPFVYEKAAKSLPSLTAMTSLGLKPDPGSGLSGGNRGASSSPRGSTVTGIGSRPCTYAADAWTITRARYRHVALATPRATCAAISGSGGSARGVKRGPEGVRGSIRSTRKDMPAPPRFLPEYDNLLLSHKDRTRVIPGNRPVPLPPGIGGTAGTFLVDGMWQGTWQIRDETLRIQPFTKLRRADRDALLTEAAQLGAFVAPHAKHDVILEKPASHDQRSLT
jgi:hypothetical protein